MFITLISAEDGHPFILNASLVVYASDVSGRVTLYTVSGGTFIVQEPLADVVRDLNAAI